MTRKEVLTRVDEEIERLERFIRIRTEPLWSKAAIVIWKYDLDLYRSIRSLTEGKKLWEVDMNYTIHKIENGWIVYYPKDNLDAEGRREAGKKQEFGETFFKKLDEALDFLKDGVCVLRP